MAKKLNCILLIDDNRADNVYHEIIITDADCAENVVAVESALAALDYLQKEDSDDHPQPDLIFLDINMPGMNGWEFLEEYEKIKKTKEVQFIVVMLTTSLNPEDKERAQSNEEIKEFFSKPLSEEGLKTIIATYFGTKE